MTRPIAPGQTVPVPFTLSETPDSTPTLTVYQSTAAGVLSDVSASVAPTVTQLGSGLEYHAYYTVPAAALHGSSYQLLVSVTIGAETTTHWLDGGTVELWASQASVDSLAGDVETLQSSVTALSGTELSSVSPVGTDGAVTVYRARDYDNDDGLALEWSNSAGTWPDLTGATIHVRLGMPGCSTTALYQFDGSAPTPSGANQTVRLELTDADLSIRPDDYTYNVVATLASGNVVQLYTGSWSVLFALEAPAA